MGNNSSRLEERLAQLETLINSDGGGQTEAQRMYMREYMRRRRDRNPQEARDYTNKYQRNQRERDPEGYRKRVNEQVKRHYQHKVGTYRNGKHVYLDAPNKRPKPTHCELCGRTGSILQYHHWDDSNPSKGVWLCYRCHTAVEVMDKNPGIVERYCILRDELEKEFCAELLVEVS